MPFSSIACFRARKLLGFRAISVRYTKGMKTAVSIPDELFRAADRLAKQTKKSRSQLYSDAVREYVAHHAAEEVTEAMDRVCADLGGDLPEKFVSSAARRVLERVEW
jgi:hypothetical protein